MARIIGLTGGIASGKSTVTSYLKEKGYSVIDAAFSSGFHNLSYFYRVFKKKYHMTPKEALTQVE